MKKAPDTTSDVLDLEGAAALLKYSTKTVRKLAAAGTLRGTQLGGSGSPWRFYREDVLALVRGKDSNGNRAA